MYVGELYRFSRKQGLIPRLLDIIYYLFDKRGVVRSGWRFYICPANTSAAYRSVNAVSAGKSIAAL